MKYLTRFVQIIPLAAILLVLFVNLQHVQAPGRPSSLDDSARLFGLDQEWTLFAPHPPRETGWLTIPATLADGSEINLYTHEAVSFEKPDPLSGKFENQRWGRLLVRIMRDPVLAHYRAPFASYLCREWNQTHAPERAIESLAIFLTVEPVRPPNVPESHLAAPIGPVRIFGGTCS